MPGSVGGGVAGAAGAAVVGRSRCGRRGVGHRGRGHGPRSGGQHEVDAARRLGVRPHVVDGLRRRDGPVPQSVGGRRVAEVRGGHRLHEVGDGVPLVVDGEGRDVRQLLVARHEGVQVIGVLRHHAEQALVGGELLAEAVLPAAPVARAEHGEGGDEGHSSEQGARHDHRVSQAGAPAVRHGATRPRPRQSLARGGQPARGSAGRRPELLEQPVGDDVRALTGEVEAIRSQLDAVDLRCTGRRGGADEPAEVDEGDAPDRARRARRTCR